MNETFGDTDMQYLLCSIGDNKLTEITENDLYRLERLLLKMKESPYKSKIIKDYIQDNFSDTKGNIRDIVIENTIDYPSIEDINILKKSEEDWKLYSIVKERQGCDKALIYLNSNTDDCMNESQRKFLMNMGIKNILHMKEYKDEYVPLNNRFKNLNNVVVNKDSDPNGKIKEFLILLTIFGIFGSIISLKK